MIEMLISKEAVCLQEDPHRCERQMTGLGGCAFDGAQIVLIPITDAAHIVHGPIACAGNSWNTRGSLSSGPMLYRRSFTTDISETDIIYSGEKRLYDSIIYVVNKYSPPAVFVYSTCVTALIGDDIDSVCRDARKESGIPIIPVNSPGFAGTKNFGNRLAGEALLEYVIGTEEIKDRRPYDINLIGEYNIAGELWEIIPLLKGLGIRVLATITGDSRYRDIAMSHRARLNVMVCSRALINIAIKMEERYGIPFIEGSFFGIRNIRDVLTGIASHFREPSLMKKREELIHKEEKAIEERLFPIRKRLEGKRVVLYTGGVKSWSVISALQDLGMEVVACGTRKSTMADIEKIKELMGNKGLILEETSTQKLLSVVRELKGDILIAGGRNLYPTLKSGLPYLDINQEREHPYTGYKGMYELARQLELTLSSPIWKEIDTGGKRDREIKRYQGSKETAVLQGCSTATLQHCMTTAPKKRPVTINPLRNSQPLGAVLALHGIDRSIPLLHGCQGCTAFGKALLIRHFREPIIINTTALTETEAIMEGSDNIIRGLIKVITRFKPEIVGIITTGLTEVKGDDIEGAIKEFRSNYPEYDSVKIISISTPDYDGAIETGYAKASESIIKGFVRKCVRKIKGHINILPGSFLTPGDIEEIKESVEAFGLKPIVLPDISGSLDGHFTDEVSFIVRGGTKGCSLDSMGSSEATIVLGESMIMAGEIIKDITEIPLFVLKEVSGLGAVDNLYNLLSQLSGRPIPERYIRQRRQLLDAMMDTHFYIGRKRFILALDPDHLWNIANIITSMGGIIKVAISTTISPLLDNIDADDVIIGDLGVIDELGEGADIIITNSNGYYSARRFDIPLMRIGFPIFDRLGPAQKVYVGYKGTRDFLFELGNLFLEASQH
jgi:nitrogenase molybdenum-cofactor synthesis protein NifE